jgi:hypothetical protein
VKLSVRKFLLLLLAAGTLLDSLLVPKGASPGHGGTFLLAWAFSIRLFLVDPSLKLALFSVFLAVSCTGSNHGIISSAVLGSPYFYFGCGPLVVWWEKVAGLFRTGRNIVS